MCPRQGFGDGYARVGVAPTIDHGTEGDAVGVVQGRVFVVERFEPDRVARVFVRHGHGLAVGGFEVWGPRA